jgi:hypothetical protein
MPDPESGFELEKVKMVATNKKKGDFMFFRVG